MGGGDLKYPLEIWHKNSWTFWGNKIAQDKITFGNNFSKPIIPGLFVTITCGILSGFHATQTPMVARIIKTEEKSYSTFYGMMNVEAFVAMIWAFLTIWVMSDKEVFDKVIEAGNGKINPGTLIVEVNKHFFGRILQYIPIIILLLLPLTSGETGFRALRLTIADWLGLKQDTSKQKILLAIPIFLVGIGIVLFAKLEKNGFAFLWQSFAFFNVGLGVVALLVVTIFTKHYAPKKKLYLIPLIPMVFWMFISFTVLFWRPIDIEDAFWWKEKETIGLIVSITLGILLTSIITGLLLYKLSYRSKDLIEVEYNPTIEELEKAKEIKKLYK
ncbi:MAG: hypothetical protein E7Y34_00705 [Mycoplasma sp.]|nr:hypothetical protein [Mycoplasma sp.]